MSRPVYIDCGVQNSQMTIGQNNASTIILGNSNCTTTTYLLNVSNISTNSLDTNASGTLRIGNTNASTINIGNIGTNVSILSKSTSISSPLTLGSSPTVNTQLGYMITFINGSTWTTSSTAQQITVGTSFNLPVVGIWLIEFRCQIGPTVNYLACGITTNTATFDLARWSVVSNSTGVGTTNQITTIINASTTTYNLLIQAASASVGLNNVYLLGTRIA